MLKGEMGLVEVAKDMADLQYKIEGAKKEADKINNDFYMAKTDPEVTDESKKVINGMLPIINNSAKSLSKILNDINRQKMGANAARSAAELMSPNDGVDMAM